MASFAERDTTLQRPVSPYAPNCLMEAHVLAWQALSYAGLTVKALEDNYGHHRPTRRALARKALG